MEEVEFLSCYVFLKNPIKSYHIDIGVVYFSSMEDKQGHKVKIALMRCSKVHDGPGGALSAAKDAILLLRPKALFSVGTCRGIESTTIKPGDVIVSSKVITLDFKIPPRRHCLKLLGHLAAGWTPPLRNANEYEVKVHPGALISIPKVNEDIIRQYSEAIGLDKDGGGENHNKQGLFNSVSIFPSFLNVWPEGSDSKRLLELSLLVQEMIYTVSYRIRTLQEYIMCIISDFVSGCETF